jgi:hypothetical protein
MRGTVHVLLVMMLAAASGCANRKEAGAAARPGDPGPQNAAVETWEPPEGLEFLRTVPELRGISLEMREQEFQELVKARPLDVRPVQSADQTSYWVSTHSGENVIVMFRNGACSGIQRMQPSPRPNPS